VSKKSTAKKKSAKAATTKSKATKAGGRAPAKKKRAAAKTPSKKAASKKAVSKKQPSKKKAAASSKAGGSKVKKSAQKPKKGSIDTKTAQKTRTIPSSAKHLHDKKWLEGQRQALLEERAKYTSSAERLAAEAAALMADREPGDVQFDEESGEGDTIAVERDRDLALSAAARQAIDDIDSALARLDDNTYGLCIAGDDVIPKERLEAIPEAAVCVQHKTSMF
jgi:RNA polymerase-binding transcription factor DksA